MREAIINIIKYRLSMGRTKEEIVTGLTFTICETLELSKQDLLDMIGKDEPVIESISSYVPPNTLNLFGAEFKKGEFDKVRSIKDLNKLAEVTGT